MCGYIDEPRAERDRSSCHLLNRAPLTPHASRTYVTPLNTPFSSPPPLLATSFVDNASKWSINGGGRLGHPYIDEHIQLASILFIFSSRNDIISDVL